MRPPEQEREQIRITGRNVMFPSLPLADDRVTSIDVHVYAILAMTESTDIESSREGWFMISQSAIAAFVGRNRSTVNRSIGKLTELGYLEKKSQIGSGGQGHNLYRIKFDQTADIPPVHDRHQLILDAAGQPDLPLLTATRTDGGDDRSGETQEFCGVPPVHTVENKGVRSDNSAGSRGVHPGNSAVRSDNSADSRGVAPMHSPETQGVQPPLIESESKILDSSSINSNETMGTSTDPHDAARIVDYFLQLRTAMFGNGGPLSGRPKLLDAAIKAMAFGLDADQVMSVIRSRMNALQNSGSDRVPATLWMFRHDFEKQASLNGPRVEAEYADTGSGTPPGEQSHVKTPRSKPTTVPTASDHRDEFVDLARSEDPGANPWLTNIADVREADGTTVVVVSSRMVEGQIAGNAETMAALSRAAEILFGVSAVRLERGHVRSPERKMVTA